MALRTIWTVLAMENGARLDAGTTAAFEWIRGLGAANPGMRTPLAGVTGLWPACAAPAAPDIAADPAALSVAGAPPIWLTPNPTAAPITATAAATGAATRHDSLDSVSPRRAGRA